MLCTNNANNSDGENLKQSTRDMIQTRGSWHPGHRNGSWHLLVGQLLLAVSLPRPGSMQTRGAFFENRTENEDEFLSTVAMRRRGLILEHGCQSEACDRHAEISLSSRMETMQIRGLSKRGKTAVLRQGPWDLKTKLLRSQAPGSLSPRGWRPWRWGPCGL